MSSLFKLLSDGLLVLHLGEGYHLVLDFIDQGLANLLHKHTSSAVPTPEVVVGSGVPVSCHQVSQGEGKLQSSRIWVCFFGMTGPNL